MNLRKITTTRTAPKGDSHALPEFFVNRAALVIRLADAEAQILKLSADADARLADLNSGPSLVGDLASIESQKGTLRRIIDDCQARLAVMDKAGFVRASDAVRVKLDSLRAAVIESLGEAIRLRVGPWLFNGEGNAHADTQNQEIDLGLLVETSPAVRDEYARQGRGFLSFADTKHTPAAWLPLLPDLLAEIEATEARLALAHAFAADLSKPYEKEAFDRFDRPVKPMKKYEPGYVLPPSRSEIIASHRNTALQHRWRKTKILTSSVSAAVLDTLEASEKSLRNALNDDLKANGYELATDAEVTEAMTLLLESDSRLAAAVA